MKHSLIENEKAIIGQFEDFIEKLFPENPYVCMSIKIKGDGKGGFTHNFCVPGLDFSEDEWLVALDGASTLSELASNIKKAREPKCHLRLISRGRR